LKTRILWPGKTRDRALEKLEEIYLEKINHLGSCEVVVTRAAKGINEKESERIMKMEADGLERQLRRSHEYVVCLSDRGRPLSSQGFTDLLADIPLKLSKKVVFIVGGFLGLHKSLLDSSDLILSLSRMTFSHELCRLMLLEQIYRSMSVIKGHKYAK
jgi:23S rRNA (pseudouridine1915-N3)-methyltransferase